MLKRFQRFISPYFFNSICLVNNRENFHCSLIIILCSFIFTSCSHTVTVRKELLEQKHNVIAIPYKSAPIQITNDLPIAVSALLGPLSVVAADISSNSERENKASSLNKNQNDWNPSVASANECVNIIKEKSRIPISNIIVEKMRELPGGEKLRIEEPNIFIKQKTTFYGVTDFAYLMSDWIKSENPTLNYKIEYPDSNADLALEVSNSIIQINKEEMAFNIIIKIFDTNSGKLVSNAFTVERVKISTINNASDLEIFKKDFSDAARSVCNQTLVKTEFVSVK
jgi:hypothetical protein